MSTIKGWKCGVWWNDLAQREKNLKIKKQNMIK
jgi:hypothetical protein